VVPGRSRADTVSGVPSLIAAVAIAVVGAVVMLGGLVLSVWSSQRRRDLPEVSALRMDPGLVVAFVGAVGLIFGLGDLVFLLLTAS
jgi:hypothetical protein